MAEGPVRHLGLAALAERAGITRGTAARYQSEGRLPAPDIILVEGARERRSSLLVQWRLRGVLSSCARCRERTARRLVAVRLRSRACAWPPGAPVAASSGVPPGLLRDLDRPR